MTSPAAKILVALVLAGCWVSGLALPADFTACDGFDTVTRRGDGLTPFGKGLSLVIPPIDHRKDAGLRADQARIARCDAALADPLLVDRFWVRRAHLLQAKAAHQIAASSFAEALATLEQSDALGVGKGDALFEDSVAIGNRMVRAYALIMMNREADARREIAAIAAARPYAPSVRNVAYELGMMLDASLDEQLRQHRAMAALMPGVIADSFWIGTQGDRFAESVDLAPHVSFALPQSRDGWTVAGEADAPYEEIVNRARFMGAWAYALEAIGQPDGAAAMLGRARHDLEDVAAPPPAPEPERKVPQGIQQDHERRKAAAALGREALAQWELAIDARRAAPRMTIRELRQQYEDTVLNRSWVTYDIVRQVPTSGPGDRAARDQAVASLLARLDGQRRGAYVFDLQKLMAGLPRPEVARIKPVYREGGNRFFTGVGMSRQRLGDAPAETIGFSDGLASKAMVEELALLSAAHVARAEGKDSLLLLSRRTIALAERREVYGTSLGETAAGHEAQVLVRALDSRSIPPELGDVRWRLIAVADVLAALEPKYLPTSGSN